MSHLGRRLSALVDGELGDTERDQVLAHLVGCDECRAEVAALRTLKRRISGLGETPADGELTRRLIALAGLPEPAPARSRPHGATRARAAFSGASPGRSPVWGGEFFTGPPGRDPSPLAAPSLGGVADAGRGRGHTRYVVAGAVAALAVGLGAASFAAGGERTPTVTPRVDVYTAQQTEMSGMVPTTVFRAGFARP